MIAGTLVLEDVTIHFEVTGMDEERTEDIVHVTVTDTHREVHETYDTPAHGFMAALGIALHYDGEPNAERDYPMAEAAMRTIRWIP